MDTTLKKTLCLIITLLFIGITPAFSFEISGCSGSTSNEGIDNALPAISNVQNSSKVQNTSLQSTNRTLGSKALTKVSKIRVSTTKEKIVDYSAASKGTADVEATRMGDNGTAQENNTQVAGANKSATTTNTKTNQTSISTKLEVDELESNNIVYVEINGTPRYTLVKEIENNTIFLSDPELGNIEMNKEDFTKIYSGYALVVSNPNEFYEINQDLTTFSETSEVKHAQFTESYENLKQSLRI